MLRLALALVATVALSSCHSSGRDRLPVVVAAGDSAEQQVLGQLTLQLLQAYGYTVVDKTEMGDAWMVRAALEAGNVDICWEYTGDTWMNHQGHDLPVSNAQELYRRVRDDDALRQITWLLPAPASHTWGLVMAADHATGDQVASIGDLVRYVRTRNPDLTLCAPEAMYNAVSGIRGLERATGLSLPDDQVRFMDLDQGYEAVASGECDCALGNSMSPEVADLGLTMLVDDQSFFPASNLAVAVRTPVLSEFPDLEPTLVRLSAQLTTAEIMELVRLVAVEGQAPQRVAKRFLAQHDLLEPHRAETPAGG
jgi:osmoprotectant transport system substrate-binding protein